MRHLCLQLFGLHRKTPSLRITDAAKSELQLRMSAITDYEPVATLLWASTGTGNRPMREPHWGVGFYDIATRPSGRVATIDGIPFVFVQDLAFKRLNGATLDFRSGRFVVAEGNA
jgi:hypothetical protein